MVPMALIIPYEELSPLRDLLSIPSARGFMHQKKPLSRNEDRTVTTRLSESRNMTARMMESSATRAMKGEVLPFLSLVDEIIIGMTIAES